MASSWHVPNEVNQQVILAGFEDGSGAAATPNFRLLGDYTASKSQPLNTRPEVTGSYVRRNTPRRQLPTYSGNYAEDLTFESAPQLLRAAIKAGATGVAVAGTTGAYDYKKAPSQNRDDIESLSIQSNVEGLGFLSTGVRFPENTITIDADDADGVWKYTSPAWMRSHEPLPDNFEGVATGGTDTTLVMTTAGWTVNQWAGAWVTLDFGSGVGEVRQVVSNTADTLTFSEAFDEAPVAGTRFLVAALFEAGIALPDYEAIPSYGTRVYLDPVGGIIGTTQILDRVISLNVTTQLNVAGKRFLENKDELSRRVGRGEMLTTFQLRVEFDRWDEYYAWKNLDEFKLRIEQDGSVLDASPLTRKLARIDIPRAAWDGPTRDARENNLTITMAGVAFLSTPYVEYHFRNGLATLP